MAHVSAQSPLAYLTTAQSLPLAASLALRIAVVFSKWSDRRRSRTALGHLDPHLLRDVGLERHAALVEARRPFWQG